MDTADNTDPSIMECLHDESWDNVRFIVTVCITNSQHSWASPQMSGLGQGVSDEPPGGVVH